MHITIVITYCTPILQAEVPVQDLVRSHPLWIASTTLNAESCDVPYTPKFISHVVILTFKFCDKKFYQKMDPYLIINIIQEDLATCIDGIFCITLAL